MDLTVLASDRGSVPMNIAAVLEFEPAQGPIERDVRMLLAERLPAVPRLRQRLQPTPPGGGRPVWIDDAEFDLGHHLTVRNSLHPAASPGPGKDRHVLAVAADMVCARLDHSRPLWRATLVTDATGHGIALIVVLHHVLADGLGGLAVLAALAAPGPAPPEEGFPRRPPRYGELAGDAARARWHGLRTTAARFRRAAAGVGELGIGPTRPRLAEKISLNRATSDRRHLDRVAVPLADVIDLAHRTGGTVNDVVLAAVTGALMRELAARAERPARLVVSVPISGRRSTTTHQLGNDTGVRPIAVPTVPDPHARLATIIRSTRSRGAGQRASSAVPLGVLFRALGALGLFGFFVDHQRLVHTFETNLRGPAEPVTFAGSTVRAIVPAAVNPGNVAVSFDVLSYAGVLGVTIVTDPAVVDEPARLADALAHEFDLLLPS
jgi:WS/DGAT/MGAT family acyltransferase